MRQQVRNIKLVFDEEPDSPRFLILDNDAKFTATSHQGKDNRPLSIANGEKLRLIPQADTEIICHERLGGLLKHYERQAA